MNDWASSISHPGSRSAGRYPDGLEGIVVAVDGVCTEGPYPLDDVRRGTAWGVHEAGDGALMTAILPDGVASIRLTMDDGTRVSVQPRTTRSRDSFEGAAMADSATGRLLSEQVGYYRARAPEYLEDTLNLSGGRELEAALEAFAPAGDVLELACGPGVWTPQLLRRATSVTAVDAAPEMLAIARDRVRDERVRFVLADVFEWEPDRRYDVVFFGFWLSHVPLERFTAFWELVDACLAPDGRVFFVDDAYRMPDELVEGAASSTIRRRLRDGSTHRLVKVAHTPQELEARLTLLRWNIAVSSSAGPFFWGAGARA